MSGIHILQFILVVAILAVIGIPLFSRVPGKQLFGPADTESEEYKHLLVRKEEVLLSIKELEFDFKTEKISAEDYETLRARLEREAVDIIEKIDALEKDLKKRKSTGKAQAT